jgi:hypothetical protein
MRLRRFAAALFCVAAPLLAGCLQTSTLVKLNPDGSGTIELTTTVSTKPSDVYSPDDPDPFTVAGVRAEAVDFGRGVTFVSAAKLDTPDRKGIRAVYAFKDIRTVSLALMNTPADLEFWDKSNNLVTFAFTRLPNGDARLTIENPMAATPDETPEPAAGTKPTPDGDYEKYVFAMIAGSKIDFAIQVGHVLETNIPYVDGGRLTLLSIDFDQVLANPASVEKFQNAYWIPKALQDVKGIKLSVDPKLTIEFRK